MAAPTGAELSRVNELIREISSAQWTTFDADIAWALAQYAKSTGFAVSDGWFVEQIRLNPLEVLLKWARFMASLNSNVPDITPEENYLAGMTPGKYDLCAGADLADAKADEVFYGTTGRGFNVTDGAETFSIVFNGDFAGVRLRAAAVRFNAAPGLVTFSMTDGSATSSTGITPSEAPTGAWFADTEATLPGWYITRVEFDAAAKTALDEVYLGPSIPSAPVATAATGITTDSFTANWNAVATADSYEIEVFLNGEYFADDTSIQSPITFSGVLSASTEYTYVVRAVSVDGTSADSNIITFTSADPAPPSAPTALAGSSIGATSFVANWSTVDGATSYRLDVSASPTFDSFLAGFQDKTVNGASDTVSGLSHTTPYFYRARAVNENGASANSNRIYLGTFQAGSARLCNLTANTVLGAGNLTIKTNGSNYWNPWTPNVPANGITSIATDGGLTSANVQVKVDVPTQYAEPSAGRVGGGVFFVV